MIDCSKDARQRKSVEKWREAKGKGTLNLIMRFGKTRVASIIVQEYFKKNPNRYVIALAPNHITFLNLVDHLLELTPDNKSCTTIDTITAFGTRVKQEKLSNKTSIKCDLLILDEVHKLLTPESLNIIKFIEYKHILCLTGSNLNKEQEQILKDLGAPIVDKIDEATAIANNWIAPSIEYNLGIELDDHDKVRYAKYTEQIVETLELFKGLHNRMNTLFGQILFNSDFDLALYSFTGLNYKDRSGRKTFIKPTIIRNALADTMGWSKDMDLTNKYNQRINQNWHPDNIFERVKKFKDYVRQRNDILICNRPKINAVIEILKRNSVSTICFNESIAMVDTLADYFNKTSIPYHSSIESRYMINPKTNDLIRYKNGEPKKIGQISLKKMAIEGMKDGTYKYLFTAQSLNEGLTIENVEQIITTGGSCNSNTYSQRVARGKTYNYLNPDKVCIIINLFIDDFKIGEKEVKSRDKQKLIQRQSMSENIPIWVNSIDEIFD